MEDKTRFADLKLRVSRNQFQGRDNRMLFQRLNATMREIKLQVHPDELHRRARNYAQYLSATNITTVMEDIDGQLEALQSELQLNMSNYRDESHQYTQGCEKLSW